MAALVAACPEPRSCVWRFLQAYQGGTRMKRTLAIAALTVAAAGSPSLAQTARQPATTPTGPSTNLPESMRIQQRTERQYFNSAVAPNSTGTTTEAPGAASSPVEPGRIDPAAPSRQRLQIDEGQSVRARENPDANAPQSGSGTSYNTIVRGAPSSSGASAGTGVSGSSGSTGTSGAAGAGSGGAASGGAASGGGSH